MKRRQSGSSAAHSGRSPPPPLPKNREASAALTATTTGRRRGRSRAAMRPSLLVLSAVWLALCSCLVWKEHRLSRIFYSFCGCFAAAAALRRLLSAAAAGRHRSLVHLLDGRRKRDALVADAVGALVCAGALHSCARHGRPYAALSLVAGYLAFGQWYTALRLTMEASWGVVEDALTLSAVLVLLATLKDESSLEPRSRQIEVWIAYKLVALLLRLLWPSPSSAHASSLSTQEARKDITANRTLQQKVSSLADNSSSTLTPVPPRRLWTIRGAEYDLSDFVSRHPGGEGAILLGRGRDCTALFESYHPFTTQHRAVLQRYRRRQPARDGPPPEEGAPPQKKPPTTSSPPEEDGGGGDEFYRVLCERVAAALRDQGFDPVRDRAATARRAAYYAGVAAGAAASGWAHVRGSWLGSFGFAVFGWLLGSLGHDAGHFCASRSPRVNEACVWAMGLLANPSVWQHQHTYAHHSHTNSFEHDPDLHHFETLLRVHRRFPLRDRYRLQSRAAFVVVAWALVVVGTCFWIPWSVLQSSSLYGMVPVSRPLGMWIHFALYFGVVMVAPYFSHGTARGATAAVLLHMFTSGLLFAFFSQINHLNERSLDASVVNSAVDKCSGSSSSSSWAKAQVETSNNFAPDSRLWHVLSNGLNLQIEHHLFPGLNHCHLHRIAPVVRQTCEDYGVQYKSYDTWRDIVTATLEWLERLSKEP